MAVGLFRHNGGGLQLARELELDVVGEKTGVPDLAGDPAPDVVLLNHKDLAYAKIRFDESSLRTVTTDLQKLPDALARALSWGAAWDMLRDAELPARQFIDLVCNNLPEETDIGMVRDYLGRASSAVNSYGHPSNRTASRSKIAATAREQVFAKPPGSDFQLAWARSFIASARSDDDLALVRGLLDGTESVDGLTIDTDFRWSIVTSLAVSGVADEELITAELERDPTDQGERYAASARAARPQAEAKAEAWERITEDPEITLAMLRAIMGGFKAPDQEELLEPYADRYFGELLTFWEKREFDLAVSFAGGMYPNLFTEAVVRSTDELLGRDALPFPIRRTLLESKDDTLRIMRGRARDAS
jgi:aminopeptidase N